jgi:hypothetical protein
VIDEYRFRFRLPNRSAAVRALLQTGMTSTNKDDDADNEKAPNWCCLVLICAWELADHALGQAHDFGVGLLGNAFHVGDVTETAQGNGISPEPPDPDVCYISKVESSRPVDLIGYGFLIVALITIAGWFWYLIFVY